MTDLLGTAAALAGAALGATALTKSKKKKSTSSKRKSSSTAKKSGTTRRKPGQPKGSTTRKTKATATRKKTTARKSTPKTKTATSIKKATRRAKSKFSPNKIIFNTLADARAARRSRKSKASIYKLPNNDFFVGDYKGAIRHKRKGSPAKLGAVSGVTKMA